MRSSFLLKIDFVVWCWFFKQHKWSFRKLELDFPILCFRFRARSATLHSTKSMNSAPNSQIRAPQMEWGRLLQRGHGGRGEDGFRSQIRARLQSGGCRFRPGQTADNGGETGLIPAGTAADGQEVWAQGKGPHGRARTRPLAASSRGSNLAERGRKGGECNNPKYYDVS